MHGFAQMGICMLSTVGFAWFGPSASGSHSWQVSAALNEIESLPTVQHLCEDAGQSLPVILALGTGAQIDAELPHGVDSEEVAPATRRRMPTLTRTKTITKTLTTLAVAVVVAVAVARILITGPRPNLARSDFSSQSAATRLCRT